MSLAPSNLSVAELEMRAGLVDPSSDTRWEFEDEIQRERGLRQYDEECLARDSYLVCRRCAEKLVNPDLNDLCGFCAGELREKAISALVANQGPTDFALAQRAKAISALRDLGYSQQEVLQVRARAVDGLSVGEIVEWLCGERREVVAA